MCRVNRSHVWKHRISTTDLLHRLGLKTIDAYITERQLQWAGHVSRMPFHRLPRKMISSWVASNRPVGCPEFTYGRGFNKALRKVGIDKKSWHELALDRGQWRNMIKNCWIDFTSLNYVKWCISAVNPCQIILTRAYPLCKGRCKLVNRKAIEPKGWKVIIRVIYFI